MQRGFMFKVFSSFLLLNFCAAPRQDTDDFAFLNLHFNLNTADTSIQTGCPLLLLLHFNVPT
jgi:hypothetical protein